MSNPVRDFFRRHGAGAIGLMPPLQSLTADAEERALIDWNCERDANDWEPVICPEAPMHADERPTRFVDGCHNGKTVTWLRNPSHGWPIAVHLAEVGGIVMELKGRTLTRQFFGLERVVSFVVDAFPWHEIESVAVALSNMRALPLRLLPAKMPEPGDINLFDYEVMRQQANARTLREMAVWEAVAMEHSKTANTLLDGSLAARDSVSLRNRTGLLIGVIKTHSQNYLHDQGWRTLLKLAKSQRTPFFHLQARPSRRGADIPVATWYLRLSETDAPNAGIVRIEVPWAQFVERWPTQTQQSAFASRLSRWIVDARCRQQSYSRMPISLEPIVRAEDSLKSLFTPFNLLRNRFLQHTGITGGALT
jgi:hypothetical protein